MVEHYVRDVGAAGSNPVTSTTFRKTVYSQNWLYTVSFYAFLSIRQVRKLPLKLHPCNPKCKDCCTKTAIFAFQKNLKR